MDIEKIQCPNCERWVNCDEWSMAQHQTMRGEKNTTSIKTDRYGRLTYRDTQKAEYQL
jgi:hypothetical protein